MTRYKRRNFTCDCCGETFKDFLLTSTNEFGYRDLDTRPAPMKRNTMHFLIHQCPYCGYVLQNGVTGNEFKNFVESDEYQTCNGMNFTNDLASKFYKNALLLIKREKYWSAASSFLNAAWVFDDLNSKDEAIHCRNKFLDCFNKLSDDKKNLNMELIRLDVLRRAGKFDIVIKEANPDIFNQEIMSKIAEFEIKKAKENDDKCYNLEEVIS